MSLEIEGLDELLQKIEKLQISNTEIDTALQAGAEPIKNEMKSLVPISNLSHKHIRNDIKIGEAKGEGLKRTISIGVGKETAWRAKFLEFGTTKMSAKPFIEPALQNKKREALNIIAQKLKEVLGLWINSLWIHF